MTTVAFAQDWNADSRTRIDMSGDNDKMVTSQRATVGATWGGSDWGIHVSSDVNTTLGSALTNNVSAVIYEAYASTDLMGYASMTAGRQALNYGSGALISSNDWASRRSTWDGFTFGLNLDMADVTVGYASSNDYSAAEMGIDDADVTEAQGNMHVNVAGEFSGWNVNVLYMTETASDDAATGLDISGEISGASVSASMNTDFAGAEMRVLGLGYAVNDDMGINVSQTVYGEDNGDFSMSGTNMNGSWDATGNLGYQSAGSEVLAYGLTYNMSGISLGATMYNVTNDNAGTDTDATEISLGYSLNDNAGLGLSMIDDNDVKYMWLTLNIGL